MKISQYWRFGHMRLGSDAHSGYIAQVGRGASFFTHQKWSPDILQELQKTLQDKFAYSQAQTDRPN